MTGTCGRNDLWRACRPEGGVAEEKEAREGESEGGREKGGGRKRGGEREGGRERETETDRKTIDRTREWGSGG